VVAYTQACNQACRGRSADDLVSITIMRVLVARLKSRQVRGCWIMVDGTLSSQATVMRMAIFSSGTAGECPGCRFTCKRIGTEAVVQMRSELQRANACSSSERARQGNLGTYRLMGSGEVARQCEVCIAARWGNCCLSPGCAYTKFHGHGITSWQSGVCTCIARRRPTG
jgi:hypothetical protein